jgi:diguanylate cyclase
MVLNNISQQKTLDLVSSIEKSRKDHVVWLNDFNKLLICREASSLVKLNHNQCGFSKFYNSVSEKFLLSHDVFLKIENTHESLHEIANKIIEKRESNKIITASDYDLFVRVESEFMHEIDIIYSFLQETHHSIDRLTALPNKGFMLSILEKEYSILEREKIESSLVFIDIDFFKKVNDKYGHTMGDRVLTHVSKIFLTNLRKYDIASRFGGEEFLIFLKHISPKEAYVIAERTRCEINRMKFHLGDQETIPVTCSFGIAAFTLEYSLEQGIANADTAMYSAKAKGRNRVEIYKESS